MVVVEDAGRDIHRDAAELLAPVISTFVGQPGCRRVTRNLRNSRGWCGVASALLRR
jgi:hypothetical protein